MGLFDFLKNNGSISQKRNNDYINENFELLEFFYEEYVLACTTPPLIFPQYIYFNGEMDAINSSYVKNKVSYLAQFNRLIDVVRLASFQNTFGEELNTTFGQEYYIRFTLATMIMSNLNSNDEFGRNIKRAILYNFDQLYFRADIIVQQRELWYVEIRAIQFASNSEYIVYEHKQNLIVNANVFYSNHPFGVYTTFNETPKKLLDSMYQMTTDLLRLEPFIDPKLLSTGKRKYVYAEFWLKKMLATIIVSSYEWDNFIKNEDNIADIKNLQIKLLEDYNRLEHRITFKVDIKIKSTGQWITIEYEYRIPTDKFLEVEYIDRVEDTVLENHNLSY